MFERGDWVRMPLGDSLGFIEGEVWAIEDRGEYGGITIKLRRGKWWGAKDFEKVERPEEVRNEN